jgi:glycerate 2-kinase
MTMAGDAGQAPILSHAAAPRVLVAPDAFKGTLTAAEAAEAMAAGVRDALPGADVRLLPLADGGDGSVDALVRSGYARRTVTARGPTGRPADAAVAVRGSTVVVELANACGIALLGDGPLAPMTSTTEGLGDAILAALDDGVRDLVICLGGSASTDGGAGLLCALGARIADAQGRPLRPDGGHLGEVAALDLAGLDARLAGVRVTVATDVTSPLLGPDGAAAVFAPQKGASPEEVALLESGLRQWSTVLARSTGIHTAHIPGAGAAGGTAAAAIAALGASVVSGADVIQQALDLAGAIAASDLVLAGEGRLDEQSLLGKGTGSVARAAAAAGVPVLAVCGRIDLEDDQLRGLGIVGASALLDAAAHSADALAQAAPLARRCTRDAVQRWAARAEPGY